MEFTKYPVNTFKNLVMNAGVLLSDFNPDDATVTVANILGATSGGNSFQATPSFIDFGEDIDNVPKNTMELKRLDEWDVKLSGSFVSTTAALAKMLALADISGTKITPRADLKLEDFSDIWLVADYSDINTTSGQTMKAGLCAVKVLNALSTGGFQIQTEDKEKGKFAFEFTGHYSISQQDVVPFEIYIAPGTSTT